MRKFVNSTQKNAVKLKVEDANYRFPGSRKDWSRFDFKLQGKALKDHGSVGIQIYKGELPVCTDANLEQINTEFWATQEGRVIAAMAETRRSTLCTTNFHNLRFKEADCSIYNLWIENCSDKAFDKVRAIELGKGHLVRPQMISTWGAGEDDDLTNLENRLKAGATVEIDADRQKYRRPRNGEVIHDHINEFDNLRRAVSDQIEEALRPSYPSLQEATYCGYFIQSLPSEYKSTIQILEQLNKDKDYGEICKQVRKTYVREYKSGDLFGVDNEDRNDNGSITLTGYMTRTCFDCNQVGHMRGSPLCRQPGANLYWKNKNKDGQKGTQRVGNQNESKGKFGNVRMCHFGNKCKNLLNNGKCEFRHKVSELKAARNAKKNNNKSDGNNSGGDRLSASTSLDELEERLAKRRKVADDKARVEAFQNKLLTLVNDYDKAKSKSTCPSKDEDQPGLFQFLGMTNRFEKTCLLGGVDFKVYVGYDTDTSHSQSNKKSHFLFLYKNHPAVGECMIGSGGGRCKIVAVGPMIVYTKDDTGNTTTLIDPIGFYVPDSEIVVMCPERLKVFNRVVLNMQLDSDDCLVKQDGTRINVHKINNLFVIKSVKADARKAVLDGDATAVIAKAWTCDRTLNKNALTLLGDMDFRSASNGRPNLL